MKLYRFEVSMKCVGIGCVAADSLEEAKEKILAEEYDDIYDMTGYEVVSIVDVEDTGEEVEEDW